MAEHQLKIMVVDDNADNRELLEDIFDEIYEICSLDSGIACLEQAPIIHPDLILLDINMPEMDGYEACRQLKENPDTALIPIVFVSALASPEERLKGFESGAEDYVTKPFQDEGIIKVVDQVLDARRKTIEFETQGKEAMNAAFQAMTNSAELGQIIQFLRESYTYQNVEILAQGLLDVTQGFGLSCCVQIRWRYLEECYGCEKDSIEAKVLERSHDSERILDFGARTLVNDEHVSLLVRNMPLDKPDEYGRLKDHLVVLVGGAEARAQALEVVSQFDEKRQEGIQTILLSSHEELKEIHTLVEQQKNDTQEVISGLTTRIEQIIFGLGLDDDQERAISQALDGGIEEIHSLAEYSVRVEQSFSKFIDELDKLVGN